MNTKVKGFIYLLLSAVYFGFMPLLVKVICADGSHDSGSIIFKVCSGNHSAVHLPESAESSDGAICGERKKDFVCDGVWLWHHGASFV